MEVVVAAGEADDVRAQQFVRLGSGVLHLEAIHGGGGNVVQVLLKKADNPVLLEEALLKALSQFLQ